MPIYRIDGEKKGGLQKYRVVVNYTDAAGIKRRVERRVYGKGAAEQAEAELRKKAVEDQTEPLTKTSRMTVDDLWKLYREEKKSDIRASTMAKKDSVLRTHVLPFLGKTPLRELTREKLLDWRAHLAKKQNKTNTKNGAYRELRALLNFAAERGLIREAPMKYVPTFRDPYLETAPAKLRYYTKDQYGRYIAEAEKWAAGRSDLRSKGIWLFFEIAYLTGMRKGEINALRWSDLEEGYVWVRRSLTQKLKGQKWVETPPKTPSSTRRLQMPKQLREDLEAHRRLQKTAPGWSEAFFVCGGPEPIPDTTLEKANEAFAKAAELPRITIHEFRHSHASLLCNAGINIKEIARRLGHADVEMTLKTYSHLYPKEEERAVTVLDDI